MSENNISASEKQSEKSANASDSKAKSLDEIIKSYEKEAKKLRDDRKANLTLTPTFSDEVFSAQKRQKERADFESLSFETLMPPKRNAEYRGADENGTAVLKSIESNKDDERSNELSKKTSSIEEILKSELKKRERLHEALRENAKAEQGEKGAELGEKPTHDPKSDGTKKASGDKSQNESSAKTAAPVSDVAPKKPTAKSDDKKHEKSQNAEKDNRNAKSLKGSNDRKISKQTASASGANSKNAATVTNANPSTDSTNGLSIGSKNGAESNFSNGSAKKIPSTAPTAAKSSLRSQNNALLEGLRAENIRGEAPKKKCSDVVASALRRICSAVLLIILVGSSANLVYKLYSRKKAANFYDNLRADFYSGGLSDISDSDSSNDSSLGKLKKDMQNTPESRLYSDEGDIYEPTDLAAVDLHTLYERMLPNLESLKKVNSATFGWIKVEGTRVDYPVVKSPAGNNDYYLSHALDKTYSDSGSIFMDYNNSTDLSKNRNSCIYGHNMNDGTMFQTIMNFRTLNQFRNGQISVYTANGIYLFTPFSVYDAAPTESFFKVAFANDTEFSEFLTEIKGKSLFSSNVSVKTTDSVVTLITCTNTVTDKRFVVHGVLTDIVK